MTTPPRSPSGRAVTSAGARADRAAAGADGSQAMRPSDQMDVGGRMALREPRAALANSSSAKSQAASITRDGFLQIQQHAADAVHAASVGFGPRSAGGGEFRSSSDCFGRILGMVADSERVCSARISAATSVPPASGRCGTGPVRMRVQPLGIGPVCVASERRANTRAASTKVGSLSSVSACCGVLSDDASGRAFLAGRGIEVRQHRVQEGALPVHVDAAAILALVRVGDDSRGRGTAGSRSSRRAGTGGRSGRRCRRRAARRSTGRCRARTRPRAAAGTAEPAAGCWGRSPRSSGRMPRILPVGRRTSRSA